MAHCICKLTPIHDVKQFDCGATGLNDWLQKIAGQHQRKGLSKTYVLVDEQMPKRILGFFTLAIRKMEATEKLPPTMRKRLPGTILCYTLARLAVSVQDQGNRYGELLLINAMQKVIVPAEIVGSVALFVDAKDATAANFYTKYGFTPLTTNPLILCMLFPDMPK